MRWEGGGREGEGRSGLPLTCPLALQFSWVTACSKPEGRGGEGVCGRRKGRRRREAFREGRTREREEKGGIEGEVDLRCPQRKEKDARRKGEGRQEQGYTERKRCVREMR